MTRVEDRNSVPAHPRNQAPNTSVSSTPMNWLWNHIPMSSGG
jgi:hypothetical protein